MSLSLPQTTFQATLVEPINFGHILEICGKVQHDADSVIINFNKPKTSSDANNQHTLLQIILDFALKEIKCCQFHGEENNTEAITTELILGDFLNEFKFYVMLAETKFHIALNNKPLINCKYNLSLAKLQIQAIEIVGKLEYIKQLDHHKYFPYIWPPIQVIDDYLDFSNDQPMAFKPGHVMTIMAHLEGNSKGRFIMHFRHACENKRQKLHVSVRFDTKKLIRNWKYRQADDNLAFGHEQMDDNQAFPFDEFSRPFKLAIAFSETEFRFAKDGKFLFNSSYRSPDVLRFITGPKLFGTNGVKVKVWAIEHFNLEDKFCADFKKYSA